MLCKGIPSLTKPNSSGSPRFVVSEKIRRLHNAHSKESPEPSLSLSVCVSLSMVEKEKVFQFIKGNNSRRQDIAGREKVKRRKKK